VLERRATTGNVWPAYPRWVLANSLAELVGLGATFAIGMGLFSGLDETSGAAPTIMSALLMTSSGVIEGVVVGLAQWWVLRDLWPAISWRSWAPATVVGALVAWFLGSLPMTLAGLSGADQGQPVQEPEAAAMTLLAAGMGLVAGLVLAFPQWRVLRTTARRAWLWLPANSVAWAAGMPIIFAAVDLAIERGTVVGGVVTMAVALLVAGAVVGAIHGTALVYLARRGGGR
jgi:hypothetical protein